MPRMQHFFTFTLFKQPKRLIQEDQIDLMNTKSVIKNKTAQHFLMFTQIFVVASWSHRRLSPSSLPSFRPSLQHLFPTFSACLAGAQSQITFSGEWDAGLSEFRHTSRSYKTINKAAYCTCAPVSEDRRQCSVSKLLPQSEWHGAQNERVCVQFVLLYVPFICCFCVRVCGQCWKVYVSSSAKEQSQIILTVAMDLPSTIFNMQNVYTYKKCDYIPRLSENDLSGVTTKTGKRHWK